MATIDNFEDLDCWKNARILQQTVYQYSRKPDFAADKALVWQIRSAAISVSSNIAEGFERSSTKEFNHFLSIAKASCGEVRSQLYVALDESYISQSEFDILKQQLRLTSMQIGGLKRYLKTHLETQ